MTTTNLTPGALRHLDVLTLRGYLHAVDARAWITPAERERAYRAAERLSGLTGEDACGSVAELRWVLEVIDRAEAHRG